MIAKVILGKSPMKMDRLLDYKIPEGMELFVGDSVIVPFGAKNTPVAAFVAEIVLRSEFKNLKYIKEKTELGRCFDEEMLSCIKWMREKYLCAYEEAVSVVVPSGASVKSEEWIVLEELSDTKRYADILKALQDAGGAMRYQELCGLFSNNISVKIHDMIKDGVLRREFTTDAKVKCKTVKAVRLKVEDDEAKYLIEAFSEKKPLWSEIIEILLMNKYVSVADIKAFTNSSGSAVSTLKNKNIVEVFDLEVYRLPKNRYGRKEEIPELNEEQTIAVSKINDGISDNQYHGFLLFGVTGSGKTEVFMRAIEKALEEGKQAIVLVPEISLTPQTVNRFTQRFKKSVAVIHSGLSKGERYDQWRRIRSGDIDIVIGARSAIFAPLKNPGIIIIDEEHSDTYKSEMAPRYDAREVAEYRAKKLGASMVLASATPAVSDFKRAEAGELELLTLASRANKSSMPEVLVCDMRQELADGNKSMLSRVLKEEIQKNLENREQTILFLNRRGFSTFVSCRECGFVAQCPNCSISMTYHKYDNTLQCHYCGHTIKNYTLCPKCGSKYIRYFGGGTQKLEEEIRSYFPGASVLRMDIDTTGKKQSHEDILKRFENDKIDILIGTQMVTKGLDFENVTLVGVVSADTMLHIDDFRSGERTFGILEQVTGRAGRGKKAGRAVIQTYSPDHEAVLCAVDHDYRKFYNDEIKIREIMWYPPYCDMVCIGFSGEHLSSVSDCAKEYEKMLKVYKREFKIDILGPIPSAISKIKQKFRWQILIKAENADRISSVLQDIKNKLNENDNYKDVVIIIDKNPIHVY